MFKKVQSKGQHKRMFELSNGLNRCQTYLRQQTHKMNKKNSYSI
jgi:hypothetical protein